MLTRDDLAGRIAQQIRALLATGEIEASAPLRTQRLADRFEVSRTPVREALVILEREGVLEQRTNRGFFARADVSSRIVSQGAVRPQDAPAEYYRLADDWIKDAVPADVTEQFVKELYGLTKAQAGAMLARAASEGWAERKAGYGWRLLPVAKTPEALEQIHRLRAVIEPAAILEPSFRLDVEAAVRLRASKVDFLGRVDDWPADLLHVFGASFHEELIRMSGNIFFAQTLIRLNRTRRLIEYRSMVDRARVAAQYRDHVEIIDLLLEGRRDEAAAFMRTHLLRASAGKLALHRQDRGTPRA